MKIDFREGRLSTIKTLVIPHARLPFVLPAALWNLGQGPVVICLFAWLIDFRSRIFREKNKKTKNKKQSLLERKLAKKKRNTFFNPRLNYKWMLYWGCTKQYDKNKGERMFEMCILSILTNVHNLEGLHRRLWCIDW